MSTGQLRHAAWFARASEAGSERCYVVPPCEGGIAEGCSKHAGLAAAPDWQAACYNWLKPRCRILDGSTGNFAAAPGVLLNSWLWLQPLLRLLAWPSGVAAVAGVQWLCRFSRRLLWGSAAAPEVRRLQRLLLATAARLLRWQLLLPLRRSRSCSCRWCGRWPLGTDAGASAAACCAGAAQRLPPPPPPPPHLLRCWQLVQWLCTAAAASAVAATQRSLRRPPRQSRGCGCAAVFAAAAVVRFSCSAVQPLPQLHAQQQQRRRRPQLPACAPCRG